MTSHVEDGEELSVAEMNVLGCMIQKKDLAEKVLCELNEHHFESDRHKVIFLAAKELKSKQVNIDALTLSDELTTFDKHKKSGGLYYVGTLAKDVYSFHSIDEYIEIVKRDASARRLKQLVKDLNDIVDSPEKLNKKIDKITETMHNVIQLRREKDYEEIQNVFTKVLDGIDLKLANKDQRIGIHTGFHNIDQRFSGFRDGDLIIIAGRPSMGKTTFAFNIAEHAVIKEKKKAVVFSLEMTSEQLMERCLANLANIPFNKIRNAQLDSEQIASLCKVNNILSKVKLYIDDKGGITIDELCGKARQISQTIGGIDVLVVDYIQLIRTDKKVSKEQEVSYVSGQLKSLAKELRCSVLALSQLNRGLELRQCKRPVMSDLRDSGAIEQDADAVMFVYRDSFYTKIKTYGSDKAEIITAKFRNGEVGTDYLEFKGAFCRFENII